MLGELRSSGQKYQKRGVHPRGGSLGLVATATSLLPALGSVCSGLLKGSKRGSAWLKSGDREVVSREAVLWPLS